MEKKIITTEWYPDKSILITHLAGNISTEDLAVWEESFKTSLDMIEANACFKIFVNLHGFKAVDLMTHKSFRTIIPITLSEYGWKVGYIGLFEKEAEDIVFISKRGITCIAAAHCHHDATKIERYESQFGRYNERFFTDPVLAEHWLRNLEV